MDFCNNCGLHFLLATKSSKLCCKMFCLTRKFTKISNEYTEKIDYGNAILVSNQNEEDGYSDTYDPKTPDYNPISP